MCLFTSKSGTKPTVINDSCLVCMSLKDNINSVKTKAKIRRIKTDIVKLVIAAHDRIKLVLNCVPTESLLKSHLAG